MQKTPHTSTNYPIPTVDAGPAPTAVPPQAYTYTYAPAAQQPPMAALGLSGPAAPQAAFGSPCDYGMCGPKVISPGRYDTANRSVISMDVPSLEGRTPEQVAYIREQMQRRADRFNGIAPRSSAAIASDLDTTTVRHAMNTPEYRDAYASAVQASGPQYAHQLALTGVLGPNMNHILANSAYGQGAAAGSQRAAQNAAALVGLTGDTAPAAALLGINPTAMNGMLYSGADGRTIYNGAPLQLSEDARAVGVDVLGMHNAFNSNGAAGIGAAHARTLLARQKDLENQRKIDAQNRKTDSWVDVKTNAADTQLEIAQLKNQNALLLSDKNNKARADAAAAKKGSPLGTPGVYKNAGR